MAFAALVTATIALVGPVAAAHATTQPPCVPSEWHSCKPNLQ
jgi:hypothetical protein